VQLFVLAGTNMFTDILLIIRPGPVLVGARLSWTKYVYSIFMF